MDDVLKKLYSEGVIMKEYYKMVEGFSKDLNPSGVHMIDLKTVDIETDKGVLRVGNGGTYCSFKSNAGDLDISCMRFKDDFRDSVTTKISLYDQDGLYYVNNSQEIDKNGTSITGRPSVYYYDLDACNRILSEKVKDVVYADSTLVDYVQTHIDELKQKGIYPTDEIIKASSSTISSLPMQLSYEAREDKEVFKNHAVQTLEMNKDDIRNL